MYYKEEEAARQHNKHDQYAPMITSKLNHSKFQLPGESTHPQTSFAHSHPFLILSSSWNHHLPHLQSFDLNLILLLIHHPHIQNLLLIHLDFLFPRFIHSNLFLNFFHSKFKNLHFFQKFEMKIFSTLHLIFFTIHFYL